MSRALPPALLAALIATAPAAARPFAVSASGNSPSVAVDASGTAHVVWDSTAADHTSTTHYCRVPRKASGCATGSERTFADFREDQDFGGPRVFLRGKRDVIVITARCCTVLDEQPTRVYLYRSADRGRTFGGATLIGTQTPDVAGALGSSGFFGLGIAENGTGLQAMPLGGGAAAPALITADLSESGGVGPSPRGTLVAYATPRDVVFAGPLGADGQVAFTRIGVGSDVVVAAGPKGADLLYRTGGGNSRYVAQRFAGGKGGQPTGVSEAGFPIFGNAFQDARGRLHAVWQGDRGLTYRRSARSGRRFGAMRSLSKRFAFYNLVVAANRRGRAAVVYDSNAENGRVGGFTAG